MCALASAQEWTIYDMQNSPLPSNTVRALAADGADGLWVGTDWGLCHLSGEGEWTIYQEGTSPLAENDIRALQRDTQGRLWIGTVSMGMQVKEGDEWTTFTPLNSPLPEFGIRDLFADANDAIWICTSGGLAKFDGTDWFIYNDTPESHQGAVLATANTNTVAVAPDG
ncbi:MAG TPA: two-component regulator propeller domain-containing protein, partial [Flavobacteriales bacterium]|nr:two-component regulator propeller domain-containing protein [Flavobacteriales bacterium]